MRSEPIEIGMAGMAERQERSQRRAMSQRFAPTRKRGELNGVPTAAVDEAFAESELRPSHRALIKNLSAQLDALDRQREQLDQLLRSIDADAMSESRD